MKVLILKIDEKTYTTGKITAYLSREALKIQKETIALAKKGKEVEQSENLNDIEAAEELLDKMEELYQRKSWLICEVYKNQFTTEQLEKEFSNDELGEEIEKILYGITGIVQKN
jgi:hypothetical protein